MDSPCSLSCIVLGPTGNLQGSYKFYNLDSGQQIIANQFTFIPIPDEVICRIKAIAATQNMPNDIIFIDSHGTILSDSDDLLDDNNPPDPHTLMNYRSLDAKDPTKGLYKGLMQDPDPANPHAVQEPDPVDDHAENALPDPCNKYYALLHNN